MGAKKTEAIKNILVTGGGGFLGNAIVRRLLAHGHRVTSFSRRRHRSLEEMGVDQHLGDVSDPTAVSSALEGRDAVFHTAAKAGVWGAYDDYFATNVTGTRNVLRACRFHRISLLIYTSSPSVVFDGKDLEGVDETAPYPTRFLAPYAQTKALAEQAVLAAGDAGLKVIVLRPHLIWGPGDRHLTPRILSSAGRLRRIGDGRNVVDTVYIDNASLAHLLAMAALERNPALSGRIYFISDDSPIRLWEMVDRILSAGGKAPVNRSVSPATAFLIGTVLEWLYRFLPAEREPPLTRFVASELATSHWFDISAAKRDLGYAPAVSIDEGLNRLRTWLDQRPTH